MCHREGGGGEFPKGGHAGRAKSLGIWPGGGVGGARSQGAKSLGHWVQSSAWSKVELWTTFFRHTVCGQGR